MAAIQPNTPPRRNEDLIDLWGISVGDSGAAHVICDGCKRTTTEALGFYRNCQPPTWTCKRCLSDFLDFIEDPLRRAA
jgi:transposase-like protein